MDVDRGATTALGEFLFPLPARRTVGGIVKWWERRRLAYNVAVGAAGLFSIGAVSVISILPPGPFGPLRISWLPILVIGGVANVCYLLGPTVEVLIEKLWGGAVLPTGPALFRMGLTFSVGLALLPTLIGIITWVVRVVVAVV